jgi:dihydrofolate reductase
VRTLTYYIGASVDGFIAGPDGTVDFLMALADHEVLERIVRDYPDTLPTHVRGAFGLGADPQRFDTVLMGRATYEPALREGIDDPYAHLRTYVFSNTLGDSESDNVTVVRDDPRGFVNALKAGGGRDIWLAGGGRLAGALLPEIDELVVKIYPGRGFRRSVVR